ncbi:TolC family protein, partial [Hydrogenimonas sp.]
MKLRVGKSVLSAAAVAVLMGGCAHNVASVEEATKPLAQEAPEVASFAASHEAAEVADDWVATFGDPMLVKLVEEAQKNNPDLRVTASRVERAAALMRLSASGLYPRVDLMGSFTDVDGANRDKGEFVGAVSWEPDVWGRLQNLVASDEETLRAMAADFAYARQSLAALTAKAWFRINSDKMLYDFMDEVVGLQKKVLKIVKEREEIGAGTKRAVHVVSAMTAESQQLLKNFEIFWYNDTRTLETLVGRYPANAIEPRGLAKVPPEPAAGIPADLLNRRPDVVAARQRVAAAFHYEKAMELLKLPSFSFSFRAGYDHLEDTIAKFLSSVFMPIIDNGEIDAYIAMANADQKAAIAHYKSVVLRAYKEVENALSQEKQLKERYDYLVTMEREYRTAYDMTVENYEIGEGTIFDMLLAQSKWIDAGIQKVSVANQRLANRVNLHLA